MPVHRTGELRLRHAVREGERTRAEFESRVEARDRRTLFGADAVRRAEQWESRVVAPHVAQGEPDDRVRPIEGEVATAGARRITELGEVTEENVRAGVRGEGEPRVAVADGALGV